jgi:superfamily II DNA or RNA helicase
MMNILKNLYDYQKDAIVATDNINKGIVCMPTGTGKTFVQGAAIAKEILLNKGKFGIYVINAPRIMLSYQLLKEVYSFLTIAGIDARYMSVHSGGSSDKEELEEIRKDANLNDGHNIKYAEIESGTSTILIKEFTEKAKSQNLPLIFFSTYNSAERINDAIPFETINLVMNDEAQYLVQEQFHDIIKILNTKRCYFFTATTISTPSTTGRGMNNKNSYGDIIYKMTPREAIDKGKMVRPRMHFVITNNDAKYTSNDFQSSLPSIISESFMQHSYAIGYSKAKMLVSVKGTSDIKRFLDSKEYKKLIRNGVVVYAVSSHDSIGNSINGDKVTRDQFLKRLQKDGDDRTKELIILHYDILAEGIDVPGITGILPLRTLNKSKFLQTYGRAARLDKDDRKRLTSGEIKLDELEEFNKPYAWVIIPTLLHEDSDDKEHIKGLISELRDYGFDPNEDITSTNMKSGLPTITGPDALNELSKNSPNLGNLIEQIDVDLEDERIAKLSKIDLIREKILKNI